MYPNHDRYEAKCDTSPCHTNYLGTFGTPEEAAQTYLQHQEEEHPEKLEKERAPPLQVKEKKKDAAAAAAGGGQKEAGAKKEKETPQAIRGRSAATSSPRCRWRLGG